MLLYRGRPQQPPVPWQMGPLPPAEQPATAPFASGVMLPSVVRDSERAAASAYAVICSFVQPELIASSNGDITLHAKSIERPARAIYTIDQRPTTLFDVGIPAGNGFSETRPREEDRSALRIVPQQKATWIEPGQPVQRGGHVDQQPRPIPRNSQEAYQTKGIRPWDERPVSFGHVSEQARALQRAEIAGYWIDKKGHVDPDKPASSGSVTEFARQPQRATIATYAIIVPMVKDEPDIGRQFAQQDIARVASRAIAAAYWIDSRLNQVLAERPPVQGFVTAAVRSERQIASPALLSQATSPFIEVPYGRGYVESTTRAPGRAESQAYWLEQWAFVGGVDVPAGFGHQTVLAPGSQRAPSAAYLLTVSFVIAELPAPGKPLLPDMRSAPRSPADSYSRQVGPQIADPMPQGRGAQTEFARAQQRAIADTYQLRGIQAVEAMPIARGWQPQQARGLDRSILAAYWIAPPARYEEIPPCQGQQTQFARNAARAATVAYVIPQRANSAGASSPVAFGYVENRPMLPIRSVATSYQMMPLSEAGLDQPSSTGYIEPIGRLPARASVFAYQPIQRANSAGESAPSSFGYLENRHMPPLRASMVAYVVSVRFSTPEILLTGTRVTVYGSGAKMNIVGGGQVRGVYGDRMEGGETT